MAKRGTFIVFEGGEGSGKDTQIEYLKELLPDAVFTKEPGGTKLGTQLRKLLLEWKDGEIDPLAEILFFSASRVEFMKHVVRPALLEGKTVISNRFALSTIAYQVYGRNQLDMLEFTRLATKKAVGEDIPDLTVLLDIDPKMGIERVEKRNDGKTRFDAETLEFHTRVREGFVKHAGEFGAHVVIDAGKSVEEVQAQIRILLASHGILST
ncbi:dTMP kinase [Patescibacteria group bacterium]|nr:MAG: dTMP kinase [Patescibacteria group bacterium]